MTIVNNLSKSTEPVPAPTATFLVPMRGRKAQVLSLLAQEPQPAKKAILRALTISKENLNVVLKELRDLGLIRNRSGFEVLVTPQEMPPLKVLPEHQVRKIKGWYKPRVR